jgi:hypothetical protein
MEMDPSTKFGSTAAQLVVFIGRVYYSFRC